MKLKKLYVLTINSKSGVCILRPTMFRSDELKKLSIQKGSSEVEQLDEFRSISYDPSALEEKRRNIENDFKRKKIIGIVKNYLEKNHLSYSIRTSPYRSLYFLFKVYGHSTLVRVSDHSMNPNNFVHLSLRYDKYKITNKNISSSIEKSLDNLVKRRLSWDVANRIEC